MINIIDLLILLIAHFIADFVMNTNLWAIGKKKTLDSYAYHYTTLFLIFYIASLFVRNADMQSAAYLSIAVVVAHIFIENIAWAVYRYLSKEKDFLRDQWFHATAGAIQLLHVASIVIIYG